MILSEIDASTRSYIWNVHKWENSCMNETWVLTPWTKVNKTFNFLVHQCRQKHIVVTRDGINILFQFEEILWHFEDSKFSMDSFTLFWTQYSYAIHVICLQFSWSNLVPNCTCPNNMSFLSLACHVQMKTQVVTR